MTLAGLLLLAALGGAPSAPAGGPPSGPYYTRPVTPEADLRQLREEIAAGRPDAESWHRKLQTYLALGELPAISELVAQMAATFPGDPAFQEARMMFLSLEGKHAEAIAAGEAIVREHPGYPTIRANLGRVYLSAKDRARGVNLLIAALEQGPIRVEDWELLLEGLGLSGDAAAADPEAVVATLREKVAANPRRASLHYVLMVALVRLGHYDEARQILTAYPELADHPELQTFLEHGALRPAALSSGPVD